MITDFFMKRSGPAPFTLPDPDLVFKKKEPVGIEKIKEAVEQRKSEPLRLEETIISPPKEAIKRRAALKQTAAQKRAESKSKTPEELEEEKKEKAEERKVVRAEKIALAVKSAKKAI